MIFTNVTKAAYTMLPELNDVTWKELHYRKDCGISLIMQETGSSTSVLDFANEQHTPEFIMEVGNNPSAVVKKEKEERKMLEECAFLAVSTSKETEG